MCLSVCACARARVCVCVCVCILYIVMLEPLFVYTAVGRAKIVIATFLLFIHLIFIKLFILIKRAKLYRITYLCTCYYLSKADN